MKLNNILEKIVKVGLFCIPFIPLIITESLFFPFVTGKNFVFRILVEIIVGAWLVLAIRKKEFRPRFSWITGAMIAFVAIMGLADLFGANPFKSFWSNFERMEGWVTLIHLLGLLLVAGSVLNTKKIWNKLFNTSIGVSIFLGFYGILQLAGALTINQGGVRLDGTFGNATYFAVYMMFHVFLTLILISRRTEEKNKNENLKFSFDLLNIFYIFTILLQVFIIYHTATRGVLLGLLGGIFLTSIFMVILFWKDEGRKLYKKTALIILAVIVVLVAGFFGIRNTKFIKNSPVLSRIATISIEDASSSRIPVWGMAIEGFKERPILGWGQENFNYIFNKNYSPKMYDQEQWFDRAHNVFLDWLVAGGILGLISYLSLFLFILIYIWKSKKKESTGFFSVEKALLTGLLAGYFFSNLFVFDNVVSYMLFIFLLAFVHNEYVSDKPKKDKLVDIQNQTLKNTSSILVVCLIIFSVYFFNVKGILSGRALIGAMKAHSTNFSESVELYKTALSYEAFSKMEIRERIAQTSNEIANANINIELKQKLFNLAKDEMLKQVEEDPNNVRYKVFLGSLFNSYKMYDEAIFQLDEALKISENKQSIMFELGGSYLNKKEDKKAMEILKKAFELDTSYIDARIIYAISAVYGREDGIVEELLVPVWGTVLIPDDRFVKAYFDTGQFDNVIDIEKSRIEADPTNIQYKVSLALAYVNVNKKTEAINQIREAIEINPAFKTQGEQFINEINAGRI